jgi:hypothetical protein
MTPPTFNMSASRRAHSATTRTSLTKHPFFDARSSTIHMSPSKEIRACRFETERLRICTAQPLPRPTIDSRTDSGYARPTRGSSAVITTSEATQPVWRRVACTCKCTEV